MPQFPKGPQVHRAVGCALLVCLAVVGISGQTTTVRPRRVVVLEFENLSAAADDWLTGGFAEIITAELTQFATLDVVRLPVMSPELTGSGLDRAVQAGRSVGSTWVVAGDLDRIGGRLRVTARLVSVAAGTVVRAVAVEGEDDELFGLQDRVADGLREGFADIAAVAAQPAGQAPTVATADAETPTRGRRPGGLLGPATAAPVELPEPTVVLPGEGRVVDGVTTVETAPPVTLPPAMPVERPPAGVVAGDVTGLLELDNEPRFGVAKGAGALTGRQTLRPPRTQEVPAIDGRLDDLAWTRAVHVTEFVQMAPLDGARGTERTEVYIAYDSATLYLGFYAHYTEPSIMRANRSDRDRTPGDDTFTVYFDPFLDQQRAYSFSVNAYGVQGDAIVSPSRGGGGFGGGGGGGGGFFGPPRGDTSWDALFRSAGQIVADGFTAEMAIPFKSLRYPARPGELPHQWGFQIARNIRGKNETVVWSPVSREVAGFLPQMGVLEGMTGLSTSRNIEILPTFTTLRFGSLQPTGDFTDSDIEPEGGLNFKYGVTSDLTADVTFNPDFSQIESDQPQIEVNQRFALFFPELRPFFLEGAEIFQFRGPVTLVHTRTIVDPLYGAKLTGKAGDTTIGVMFANDESPIELDDPDDPNYGKTAQTFVGRARYDLYAESYIGAIYTDRQLGDSYNRVAGVDSNFRVGNTHSFGVRAVATRDRDLDGLETSGYLFDASVRKTGRNLSYILAHYALSPDFETDVGFVRRTDQQATFAMAAYQWWPEHWIINWGPTFNYMRGYNFDRVLEDEQASAGVTLSFTNNIRFNTRINRDMERFGGVNFFKTRYRFNTVVSADRRYAFGVGGDGGDQIFYDDTSPYLGRDRGWNAFLSLRAFPRWRSRFTLDTNRFVDVRDQNTVFDVNIIRGVTTYQFTDRLLFRNITEYNSLDQDVSLNFLFTYRVNAGTVFYIGYDERYQQADLIEHDDGDPVNNRFFQSTDLTRTNRAVFLKFQYLFRL